jgi:hypothetical protein
LRAYYERNHMILSWLVEACNLDQNYHDNSISLGNAISKMGHCLTASGLPFVRHLGFLVRIHIQFKQKSINTESMLAVRADRSTKQGCNKSTARQMKRLPPRRVYALTS